MFKNRKLLSSKATKPFLMPLIAFAFVLALASCGGAGASAPSDGGNGDWRILGAIGNTSSIGIPISGAATKIVGTIEKLRTSSIDFSGSTEVSLKGTSEVKSCNKTKAVIIKNEVVGDITLAVVPGVVIHKGETLEGALTDPYLTFRRSFSSPMWQTLLDPGKVFVRSGCNPDIYYSSHDFPVTKGTIKVPFGDEGFRSFAAYSVKPAKTLARQYSSSPHVILYHFKKSDIGKSFTINSFTHSENNVIKMMINTGAAFKVESEWQQLPITEDQFPVSFFVASEDQKVELYRPLSSAVKGVEIGTSDIGTESLYQVALNKSTTPVGVDDYKGLPGRRSGNAGQNRFFHLIKLSDDSLGIVWQDRIKYSIYLTKFKPTGETSTIELPNSSVKSILGAAAHDASGSIYYFTVGANHKGYNITKTLSLMVYKVSETGKVILKKELNTSTNPLNMTYAGELFSPRGIDPLGKSQLGFGHTHSMKVSGKKVALIFSRAYPNSPGYRTHHSATMLVLDDKFNVLTNEETKEGSSGNFLSVASDGSFIGADLSYQSPRGINFHKTYGNNTYGSDIASKVVYTFKAQHERGPRTLSGLVTPPLTDTFGKRVQYIDEEYIGHDYDGIIQFYSWSQDRKTYTELGSVVETDKGYLMFFLGEEDRGVALDNSEVFHQERSRSILYVLINKDIKSATRSHGAIVNDDLSIARKFGWHVFSREQGAVYDDHGTKREQQNTGVGKVPLNDYTTASRLSAVKRSDGNVLLTWDNHEFGSKNRFGKYRETTSVVFDSKTGKTIGDPIVRSGSQFNRSNQPLRIGKTTYFVTGNEYKHTLQISTIKEK